MASFALTMELRFKSRPETQSLVDASGESDSALTLNLSEVRFMKPSTLVTVAAVAAAHYERHGNSTTVVAPYSDDVRRYASRMLLGRALADAGVTTTGLPYVRHHDRSDQLCELTRFRSNLEAGQLVNLVQRRCQGESLAFEVEDALTQAVWELADNCLAHARVGYGFLAAQVLQYPRRALHFAVADGGIGIRRSLIGTVHECEDDSSAIVAAAQRRVTSVRGRVRGIGLPNLLVRAVSSGGDVTIRSGTAAVSFGADQNNDGFSAHPANVDELVGTLVSGWLPC